MSDRLDANPAPHGDDAYESLARAAGQELRRPAPAGGPDRIRATRRRQQRTRVAAGGVTLTAVIAVGVAVVMRDQPQSVTNPPEVTAPDETTPATALPEPITTPSIPETTTPAPAPSVDVAPIPEPLSADATAWRDAQVANGLTDVRIVRGQGTTARLLVASNFQQTTPEGSPVAAAVVLDDGRVIDQPADARTDLALYAVGGKPAIVQVSHETDPAQVWALDSETEQWTSTGDLGLGPIDGEIVHTLMPFGIVVVGDVLVVTVEEFYVPEDGGIAVSPNRRGVVVHPDLAVTAMAQSPEGVPMLFSAAAQGKALEIFGPNGGPLPTPSFRQPWSYDPLTDTWSEIALPDWFSCSQPLPGCEWHQQFDGGTVFELVTGRGVLVNVPDGTVGLYDPTTNSWTRLDAPFEIGGFWSASVVGDHVVVANGGVFEKPFGTIGVLDLATGTWTSTQIEFSPEAQAVVDEFPDKHWDVRAAGSRVMAAPSPISTESPIDPITVYDATTGRWSLPTADDLANWALLSTHLS